MTKESHTLREIRQQPSLWKKAVVEFATEATKMDEFLQHIQDKHDHVRVIFTGAGTSAFVGETVYPSTGVDIRKRGWVAETVSTTNLTSTPYSFLDPDTPTILVSFARSGNSPESIAAVELAESIVKDFYEITITCNRDGALAQREKTADSQLVILLPDEANDKGLAMTSSFSTMLLAAVYLFTEDKTRFAKQVDTIAEFGEKMLAETNIQIPELLKEPISRAVYLGSGVFEGLSRESSLKCLELTGGSVATMFDTPLGFRHGPKSFLNEETMVVLYLSNHSYTRKYDMDMLKELHATEGRGPIVVISEVDDREIANVSDYQFVLSNQDRSQLDDIGLTFANVIFAQSFAYEKSIHSGLSPDNPSPTGVINRVVQGVTIYPFEEGK